MESVLRDGLRVMQFSRFGIHHHADTAVTHIVGKSGGRRTDAHIGLHDLGVTAVGIDHHHADGVDRLGIDGPEHGVHHHILGDDIEGLLLGNELVDLLRRGLLAVDRIMPVLIGQAVEPVAVGTGGGLHSQLALALQHGKNSLQVGLHIPVAVPHLTDVGTPRRLVMTK